MSLDNRIQYTQNCSRCSQCKFVPVVKSEAFSSICPSMDFGEFHAYSGGGKVISAFAYNQGKVRATPKMLESVYACTMCGACDTSCKTNMGDLVEPFDTLLEFRARLAEDRSAPVELSRLVENLKEEGAPHGLRVARNQWAEGLDVKDAGKTPVEVLLHVGSENAYDPEQWRYLHFLVKILDAAKIDFGFVHTGESDSGGLAYEIGYRDIADGLADEWRNSVKMSKAKTVLAASAEAYAAFKNIYPRLGKPLDGVRILHTTEFVDELIRDRRLALKLRRSARVAYHDSCRLGRRSEPFVPWSGEWKHVLNTLAVSATPREVNFGNRGNYDAPRSLLTRIEGLEWVDFERSRSMSYCCGGACGVPEAFPEMLEVAALNLFKEAQSLGVDLIVTGSGGCQKQMADVASRHHLSMGITGVFDLLADSVKDDQ